MFFSKTMIQKANKKDIITASFIKAKILTILQIIKKITYFFYLM